MFIRLCAGAALAACAALIGAEPTSSVTMAWIIDQARAQDPRLAAGAAEVARLRAAADQRRRWEDPAIVLEAGRLDEDGGSENHFKVTLSQRLPLAGSGRLAGAALLAEADAASADGRLAAASALAELREAVLDWSIAGRQCATGRDSLALAEALVEDVERHLAVNAASEGDRLRAQVERIEAQQALAAAERRLATARAAVLARLAVDVPGLTPPPLVFADPPARADLARLAADHPAVIAATARLNGAQRSLAAERAGGRPDLDVGVFGERAGDSTDLGIELGIALPVWNGNRAGAESARHGVVAAGVQQQMAQRQVRLAAEQAHDAWTAATATAIATAEVLAMAQRARDAAKDAYARGEGDLSDVLDARRTLVRIAFAAAEAAGAVQRARIALDLALGVTDGFNQESQP